ncbi:MAG: hypothetical protein M1816_002427 [Peltula sp. TS41687]|nr:MAG: hypothetical protein M1816_002427 [Peltula sp. TS41687]
MLSLNPVPSLARPTLILLLLTLVWAVSDAWAVGNNAQKSRIPLAQRSTYMSNSRKIIARNEAPRFESWSDYLDRYTLTIEDDTFLFERMADAYRCVLNKMIDWSERPFSLKRLVIQRELADATIFKYRDGRASAEEIERVGTHIKECVQRFATEDSLDAQQKRYFDSCVLLRTPRIGPLSEIGHKFCVAYARGQVDPDLINKPDREIKPALDGSRQGEQHDAADDGRSMFSLNNQMDNVGNAFMNGFKKLAPVIKNAKPAFTLPGFGNPIGGVLHPI